MDFLFCWKTFQLTPVVKNPPPSAGDTRDAGLIPELRKAPGGGNGNPLHYSCLENSMGTGGWWATIHRVAKSQTWLSTHMQKYQITQQIYDTIYSPAAAAAKSLQSCPTLCDPIDGSPPSSPVPGILQARILEWVAISFSNTWKWKWSRVRLLAIPWTAAYQAPPSMGPSGQEYWSG